MVWISLGAFLLFSILSEVRPISGPSSRCNTFVFSYEICLAMQFEKIGQQGSNLPRWPTYEPIWQLGASILKVHLQRKHLSGCLPDIHRTKQKTRAGCSWSRCQPGARWRRRRRPAADRAEAAAAVPAAEKFLRPDGRSSASRWGASRCPAASGSSFRCRRRSCSRPSSRPRRWTTRKPAAPGRRLEVRSSMALERQPRTVRSYKNANRSSWVTLFR